MLFNTIVRIIVGLVAITSFVVYSFVCLTASSRSLSRFGLRVLLASGFLSLAVMGMFVASGETDFDRILIWGIGGSIFGAMSFCLLWIQHGLIIPKILDFTDKKVEKWRKRTKSKEG